MSAGTLFSYAESPKSVFIEALCQKKNIDVKVNTETDKTFASNFPLELRPAFLTIDSQPISETLAIAYYLVGESDYFGKTHLEKTNVLKWYSFINSELLSAGYKVLANTADSELLKIAIAKTLRLLHYTNDHFASNKYIAAEYETVADLYMFVVLGKVFEYLSSMVGEVSAFPNIEKWFQLMA